MKKENSTSEEGKELETAKLDVSVLKKDFSQLGIFLVLFITILQIVFYKESLITTGRVSLSIFWMFIIPGFMIMYYWFEKFSFIERIILGTILSAGIVGIIGYYMGLLGLPTQVHGILIPLAEVGIGSWIISRKLKEGMQ